ncbi:MAG TPA: hypothetical protein VH598_05225 [Verrucomicrobiae bacterium]|jgi:FtsH-binding integral membrane protein|nr:hypothetical protein [Verrucomicrobiae bacterium]
MIAIGYILIAFGLIAGVAGNIMFLTVAYKRNLWWFFGCLFIPIVWLIFFLTHWKATIKPFAILMIGLVAAILGACFAGIDLCC